MDILTQEREWLTVGWLGVKDEQPTPHQRAFIDFHAVDPDVPGARCDTHVYGTGGGRDLELILYSREDVRERRPAVVFVHGGGWSGGTPLLHMRHARAMAATGYVAATIRYRLRPETNIPGCVADAKCAIRWMRANATRFGADPDRIGVSGGSAGGHLSAMVALTPGTYEGDGGHPEVSSAAQAAVCWYPATQMWGEVGHLGDLTTHLFDGDEALAKEMSPVTHVRADAPPILTITGDQDTATPLSFIREFHDKLDAVGAPNELLVRPGLGHAYDFAAARWPADFEAMRAFFDEVL